MVLGSEVAGLMAGVEEGFGVEKVGLVFSVFGFEGVGLMFSDITVRGGFDIVWVCLGFWS